MEKGMIGFFGKIPANGDFVTRQLKQDTIDNITNWMMEFIDESKKQLGDNWLSIYLTSPVWRFATSAGCFNDYPCQGIIFPSVDKVGRYFPMMVLANSNGKDTPIDIFLEKQHWYENVEKESLLVLDDSDTLEGFVKRLELLSESNNDSYDAHDTQFAINHSTDIELPIALTHTNLKANQVFASTIDSLLTSKHEQYSLWWTDSSNKIPPGFMLCQGVPSKRHCVAMLDGQWEASGWSHINRVT